MRTPRAALLLLGAMLFAGGMASPASAEASFGFFYSSLSPHGSWLVSASLGRVWQPAVYAPGWSPYSDGHWTYTDCGWAWMSDYPWGDIAFHYGTWALDPVLGWVWVPGYVWAPSWVVFRTCPGYVGWAPVLPGFRVGISLGIDGDADRFVFVADRDFLAPRARTVIVPSSRARTVFSRTTVIPNSLAVENRVVVNRGPSPALIESLTGRRIEPVRIDRVARVSRAGLQVSPARLRRGLSAAEPSRSGKAPLPERGRRAAPASAPVSPDRGAESPSRTTAPAHPGSHENPAAEITRGRLSPGHDAVRSRGGAAATRRTSRPRERKTGRG